MNRTSLFAALGGILFLLSAVSGTAQVISPEPGNLIRKLTKVDKAPATEITAEDVVVENGTSSKSVNGVSTAIHLKQPSAAPLLFSCESECEDISGKPSYTYGIYVDAQYTDGTLDYGIIAPCNTGTHGWETASVVFFPKKPVSDLYFYILLRWRSGFAAFRNALVRPATEQEIAKARSLKKNRK